jgi:methyl-accepting chemotaxis protein
MNLKKQVRYLCVAVLVPLVALSATILWQKSSFRQNALKSSKAMEEFSSLMGLVHEMQRERGLSAGYLASGGKKNSAELSSQRQATDAAVSKNASALTRSKSNLTLNLTELRNHVSTLSAGTNGPKRYTEIIGMLISSGAETLQKIEAQAILLGVVANLEITRTKEFLGQERALVNAILSKGSIEQSQHDVLVELKRVQKEHWALVTESLSRDPFQILE